MQMYEIVAHFSDFSGFTLDESFVILSFSLLAFWGGLWFIISLAYDLGRCLYRIVKELFFLLLSKFRRKGSVEP